MPTEKNFPSNVLARLSLTRFFGSLYWKISVVFLFLVIGFGIAQGVRWRHAEDRSTQLLNRGLAAKLAEKIRPSIETQIDDSALLHFLYEIKSLYSAFDVYLLDASGRILSFFGEPWNISSETVAKEPIEQFLSADEPSNLPIFGDDPKSPGRPSVFSAASVVAGNKPGYLYVVLNSEHQTEMRNEVVLGFTSGSAYWELALMITTTSGLGLIFFFFLTRRFHRMTEIVRRRRRRMQQRADLRKVRPRKPRPP